MSDYFVSYVYYAAPSGHSQRTDAAYSHGFGQSVIGSDTPFATQDDFMSLTRHLEERLREKGSVDPKVVVLNVQRCPI